MNSYLGELRMHWRAVLSATLGLAAGIVLFGYTAGIMGPALVREFHWPEAWLALIPMFSLSGLFVYPLVGRLADTIGARPTAAIGVVGAPLIYLSLSAMHSFTTYAVVMAVQCLFMFTTTPQVYCRVIVQHFDRARGLALAIASAGPSIAAAVGAPLLNDYVADHGWRAGYVAISLFTLVLGVAALVIMPPHVRAPERTRTERPSARADFGAILRTRTFWLLFVSMLLVNLPSMPLLTQMTLILSEAGVAGKAASGLLSAYAIGNLAGRFISGVALDRLPPRLVAFASLTLSAAGLLLLSLQPAAPGLLLVAMLLVGLAYGAETDILGFLVHRFFAMRVFSTVYAMLGSGITIASASGALTLSLFLSTTGHYWPFLMAASGAVLVGSAMLLLLPRDGIAHESEERSGAPRSDRAGVAAGGAGAPLADPA